MIHAACFKTAEMTSYVADAPLFGTDIVEDVSEKTAIVMRDLERKRAKISSKAATVDASEAARSANIVPGVLNMVLLSFVAQALICLISL